MQLRSVLLAALFAVACDARQMPTFTNLGRTCMMPVNGPPFNGGHQDPLRDMPLTSYEAVTVITYAAYW